MDKPFTYDYKDGMSSTVGIEEMYDRQTGHDDLRIRDRFIEYDKKNKNDVAYMTYILDKREDDGPWNRWIKVVKLCKVYNVPKELREKKALMVSQDELLSSIWKSNISFITIYCNIPEDDTENQDVKGFYYCYGVQRSAPIMTTSSDPKFWYDEDTPEEKKIAITLNKLKQEADADFSGLVHLLRGNFRQSQFLPITMKEAEAIRRTIENADMLQVIRGIPKTHISAASGVTTSLNGITTTPEGIEQNEEFIRGLLHDKYANVIMAFPIDAQSIVQWSQNIAKELSKYKSQYSGMISHNAGVSIPMVFAGNLSATMGNTHGITDTTGETIGTTQGQSDNYTHGVGVNQGTSHNLGYSQGQSIGVADSVSQANTNSASQGVSQAHTMANTVGVSQTESNGVTDGVSQTHSLGRSHSVGTSDTYSEGQSFSKSQSHSMGHSTTFGHTMGETLGETSGVTQGHTRGITDGTSFTHGNTFGNTFGHTVGNTHGNTFGNTLGYTEGNTTGHTLGTTHGITQGHTIGNTTGVTDGYTQGHTVGNTTGTTQGHTTGNTVTTGHTTGNTISDGTSHSISDGTSDSNTYSRTHGITNSTGRTLGISETKTHSDGTSNGTTVGTSNSFSHSAGETSTLNSGSSNNSGRTAGYNGGLAWGVGRFGVNESGTDSWGDTYGKSQGNTTSDGYSHGLTQSRNFGTTHSDSFAQGNTDSRSYTQGISDSASNGYSQGRTHGISNGTTHTNATSNSFSQSNGFTNSNSFSQSNSQSISDSTSHSLSHSNSRSMSDSLSNSLSNSASDSFSRSASNSMSKSFADSLSHSTSDSFSRSMSDSYSRGLTRSLSDSDSLSNSLSNSHALSNSYSVAQGLTEGYSEGVTQGRSLSHSVGRSVSDGITETKAQGTTHSNSHSLSNGVTRSQSDGQSVGQTNSLSQGTSAGTGRTANQGLSKSLSDAQGVSAGTSVSDSRGQGTTTSKSNSLSNAQGLSNAKSSALGVGQGLNFSFGPTIGVSRSYQVFDEEKGNLIKLLEASNTRMNLAVRMGAFYVDAYVASYSAKTARAIETLSVTSWAGDNEMSSIQCVMPTEDTQNHLLKHTSVFEPCTMKENIEGIADNYLWATIMLSSELAALTHLPRVETGGVSTIATNIPAFSMFANKDGEIYFGKQINPEDGMESYDYSFSKKEFMHTLICGASGCGKTTSAVRIAREVIRKYDDMKIFALDWKNSWRVLKRFSPNGVDDFEFFGLDYTSIRPIKMNLYVPPKYVGVNQWIDKVNESICLGYGFGTKMMSVLKNAARVVLILEGILHVDEDGTPHEYRPKNREEKRDFDERMCKVTLAKIYQVIRDMKQGAPSAYVNTSLAKLESKAAKQSVEEKFQKSGMGMQDAYDSILAKLESFYSGELKEMYCEEDCEKIIRVEELIDGKRIVVLEGGDLDSSTKKCIIELISHGLFMYSRLKKNREKIVEKRFYILEEAHRIIDNPEGGNPSPLDVGETIFDILLNEAREYGVYCMIIVQTPSSLPPSMITNCSILIIHRLGNDKDVQLMTTMLCRNARLDNRDVPIWLVKEPKGQAIVRINNTMTHQESEPCLVQVARCDNEAPDNEELVLDMENISIPDYIEALMNDDEYLQSYRSELDKFINHEENEIDMKYQEYQDDYHNHEVHLAG